MNTVDKYIAELDSLLNVNRKSRIAILEEVRDHLIESTERQSSPNLSQYRAESIAISKFGKPILIARHFNASFGAKVTRSAPKIAISSGLVVVGTFLLVAINLPNVVTQATAELQVSFFLAVITFQIAVIAGACGASRTLATWHTLITSGSDRLYVRKCTVISMSALLSSAFAMSTNFIFGIARNNHVNKFELTLGSFTMLIAAGIGLLFALKLKVNSTDEETATIVAPSHALFTLGESVIKIVRRYPFASSLIITTVATVWTITHAETATLGGSWPWATTEAISVISAFLFLGPSLGLRSVVPLEPEYGRNLN